MSLTEVVIEDEAWYKAGLEALAERAGRAALVHLGLRPEGYLISILGCDDVRIAALNGDFRGKDGATNVLSWPSEDRDPGEAPVAGSPQDPEELGDIAIAFQTCEREALSGGIPLDDHVTHLIVHATLHLLGYDHEDDQDAALMERTETAILSGMGISDPYTSDPAGGK